MGWQGRETLSNEAGAVPFFLILRPNLPPAWQGPLVCFFPSVQSGDSWRGPGQLTGAVARGTQTGS